MEHDVTGEVRAAGAVEDNVSRPTIARAVDEVTVRIALQPREESAVIILEGCDARWKRSGQGRLLSHPGATRYPTADPAHARFSPELPPRERRRCSRERGTRESPATRGVILRMWEMTHCNAYLPR